MKSEIDERLDRLIEEIKSGRDWEECLKEYPEDVEELRPLLHLVRQLYDLPAPEPEKAAVDHTLRKVREIVQTQQSKRGLLEKFFPFRPILVHAIAVVVLLIVVGWTTVFLSARSLPGDVLYPVKCLCEKIELMITTDPEGRAQLHLKCAGRRTDEFVLTFRQGEKIDSDLLNAMIREKQLALRCSEQLDAEPCMKMAQEMKGCNQHQIEVLEAIKRFACVCDTQKINEAINSCIDCDTCIERLLNPAE